jgi:hypothetical protein
MPSASKRGRGCDFWLSPELGDDNDAADGEDADGDDADGEADIVTSVGDENGASCTFIPAPNTNMQ